MDTEKLPAEPRLDQLWNRIRRYGLGDTALRFATAVSTILLVVLVVWVMKIFYFNNPEQVNDSPVAVNAETLPTPIGIKLSNTLLNQVIRSSASLRNSI